MTFVRNRAILAAASLLAAIASGLSAASAENASPSKTAASATVAVATRYATAMVAGRRVFYREAGSKDAPAIVLLHGFPSSSHMYRDLIPLLADRFHVIAPDYVGFGYSDAPTPAEFDYTFDNLAKVTEGLIDQLGLKRYVLFMQDYGGPVGFRLATAHPERVGGLVIQNANAYLAGIGKPLADVFMPFWKERNAETEAAARRFLTPETTKFEYATGVRNPGRHQPRRMDARPGAPRPFRQRRDPARAFPGLPEERRTLRRLARLFPAVSAEDARRLGQERPAFRSRRGRGKSAGSA
jgi:pimeloyl-ACP methyl ester carboxylesterase